MPSLYHNVFSDRNIFSQEEQDEFENGSRLQIEIGWGAWITIFFSTKGRLHRLYLLELAYKSSLLKFGIPQFQLLEIDNEKPITNAARRTYETYKNDREWFARLVNSATDNHRKDKAAWHAINVVEAAVHNNPHFRGRLHKWVYDRYENPRCPVYVETEDFQA